MKKIYLILILLVGALLRFYNNTAVALWHDEAFSALYIKYGWGEMIHRIILDVHPPLYYFILRLWSYVFGYSLLSLRSLSILFGVLTIWAAYKFVLKAFKNESWALFSALLIAINPFQIQYSLEARMYTLGTFLLMYSSYILLKALEGNKKKDWIIFGILTAASLYTHYYLVFSIFAQGLYILYYILKYHKLDFTNWRANHLVNAALSVLITTILYIPWLPAFNEQRARVQASYWIPPMDRWSIPGTIWKMVFGGTGINRPTLAIATLIGIMILFYFIRKIKLQEKWLIVLSLTIPFLAAVVLSLKTAIYLDRYFVFASLFMSIILGIAILQISKVSARRTLAIALIAVTTFVFFKNWSELDVKAFGSSQVKKPGMSAASEYINERASRNNKIYVGSSFIYFTYKYYNHTGITPRLISSAPLSSIPHFSGTAILTDQDLILDLNEAKKNDNVWLIWTTGFGGSKPGVPGNWQVVEEQGYEDTPGFKGWIIITRYHVN